MFIAKMSIDRPIMTTMVLLVFLIFGYISFTSLNLNNMPEVDIPYVTVSTIYPGAGPKDIETQISKKIEDAVSTVSMIKRVESYSLDGISIVMIEFNLKKDVDIAKQEVKDKVDEIANDMPADAQKSIIQKVDFQAIPIIDLVVSGNKSAKELRELTEKQLKDRFAQIAGVAKVGIIGGQKREIHVTLDDKLVFENMISLPQMLQILKVQNMNIPGGYFRLSDQEYTVRLNGEYKDLRELEELEIPTIFGRRKLREIAKVEDVGEKIRERAVYFNNETKIRDENVVRISLVKSSDGNAVNIANEVYKALPEIEKTLPPGVQIKIVNDVSSWTRGMIEDTLSNIYLGMLFTAFVLLFFLHDLRSMIIVSLSMPTSVIATFIGVKAMGFSLNTLSMMGISVSIGALVSSSIVVLENIFRYKDFGHDKKDSAYHGTAEVVLAVAASTLTNIVVFVPLANMSSMVGGFLKEMAVTATFATIFSLITAFTLTPMLASLILPHKVKIGALSKLIMRLEKVFENLYAAMLKFTLKNNWIALGILILTGVVFVASAMIYGSKLGFEFMPVNDDGKLRIEVRLPEGYNLDATTKVTKQIEDILQKYPEVTQMITNVGKASDLDIGTNLASMEIQVVDKKEREKGILEYITLFTRDLADIPNARLKIDLAKRTGGPGAPIEFYLQGQDLATLEKLKKEVMDKCKEIPGLVNFDNSSSAGKPEITITPKREKIAETGLSIQELAFTIRASIEGIESTQYKEKGEEYDVKVMMSEGSVNTPEKIANIPIITPLGTFRLSQIADVDFSTGFTKVLRRDKFTAVQFTGSNAEGFATGDIINEVTKQIETVNLPAGYRFKWGGSSEMQMEMVADLGFAFLLAFILTYMLMAAMLESLWQPVLILLTLPLGMIGVFILMYYTDTNFGLTSMMGVIMLIGIVFNNAILVLDYTNQLIREKGYSIKDALLEAGPTKLKPVIMSTVALILGMLPMAIGIGSTGAEMNKPLGVVSIGGFVASTVLTLFVIPSAFMMVGNFLVFIKRKLGFEGTLV